MLPLESLLKHLGLDIKSEFMPAPETTLSVVFILILTWVLLRLARRAVRLFKKFALHRTGHPEEARRVETLSQVIHYLLTVIIAVIAVLLVLSQLGISIAPLLGAAGVVGIAVGFGAQSLVKDFFTGFFILLENQIRQGDVVQIAGRGGLVEEVTLRHVRLRDYEGNVHFIPTGMIDSVTNMSLEFSFALIDVGVAYREDIEEVFEVVRETAAKMREDEIYGAKIIADFELAGVDKWADSAVVVRGRFKVLPLEQWNVRREFLRRLKQAFDARGIEIPYPHLTIYPGMGKDGGAPPLRLVDDTAKSG
jgi:moderate conductance mechanosensitive channel